MPAFLLRAQQQLLSVWSSLSLAQRLSLAAVAVITAGVLVYFVVTAFQPTYAVAFTKLSEEDAGQIVAKLKELKVPYELADGGTTIKVPANKLHETRLTLAQAGLTKSGQVGFELFDQTNLLGLTDFNQRLNYQRALEGELARTISTMAAVESARVHVVLPKEELFSSQQKPASASVVLKLKNGQRLDPGAVRAITNLVAGSVEGLRPEQVSIVDVNGNVLWDERETTQPASGRAVLKNLEAQARFERDVEAKVQTMLDRVLGPGRATARVSADMSWDQVQTATETYAPGAPRSQRETTERFQGSSPPAGVPGVATNVPGAGGANAAGAGTNTYEKRDIVTNYELSKTVVSTVQAPGTVRRMTVAVFVDNLNDPAAVQAISQAVANAAGLSAERGDTITVSNISFDRSAQEAERRALEAAAQQQLYLTAAKGAGVVAALIIAVLLVSALFGRRKPEGAPTVTVTEVAQKQLNAARAQQEQSLAAALDSMRTKLEDHGSPLAVRGRALEEQIANLARNKPNLIAEIVERWIDEKD
ncbi:MAG: flagellar basal-body MS-ring/collar protein FliF [Chloroflexota bacterium]|nr:flagellar basal-body MS-ring/collar protein FliF [Dehalococcoidia bacterium]MDW8255333.1 flagellar basal-body MS-ring/collar protein FliF [Chloroflexota bacterium]